jgi:hypothetical protein
LDGTRGVFRSGKEGGSWAKQTSFWKNFYDLLKFSFWIRPWIKIMTEIAKYNQDETSNQQVS